MGKVRVMIVDDLKMARDLFALYLKDSETYELIRSLEKAVDVLTYVEWDHIDLVIMDILTNDGTNGLETSRQIKAKFPNVKIVAVTSMLETAWINQAKKIGIDSFWYKEASGEVIMDVLDRTMAGESVYPDKLPRVRLGNVDSSDLSEGEMKVLRLMTTGMSNTRIAEKLGITLSTVKTHIHNMLDRTGCDNRTELAIKARVSGIAVSLEDE